MFQTFTTDGLPTAHRFEAFREQMSLLHAPMDMASEHAGDYTARMRTLRMGSTVVYEASGPFDGVAGLDVRELSMVGVEIPRARLPFPGRKADALVTRPLSGREGVGALVAAFLLRLTRPDHRLRVTDALRLEPILLDLIATLFAHATDAEDALPAETRQQVLALRIRSFVNGHLPDPELTPAVIAAAHHISVSHLHRVFQEHLPAGGGPVTVMGWVREQRLERARRDRCPARGRDYGGGVSGAR